METREIHHITAIASSAQKCFDFYTVVLGLRLVKKTVNQDDVETYHLFFGDRYGNAGLDLTFFIFLPATQGSSGYGQVTKISFAVPKASLAFWENRFQTLHITYTENKEENKIIFYDFDNQKLELVGIDLDENENTDNLWTTSAIQLPNAIRSFYAATLSIKNNVALDKILTTIFGYKKILLHETKTIYQTFKGSRAALLELDEDTSLKLGLNTAGTVHHIAFRAENEEEQMHFKQKVIELGLYPTEVIDRFYFKSVYFRIPEGILFEIATDGSGFTVDEKEENLGKKLDLPPFLEQEREMIEANLLPIHYETNDERIN